jgi:16S rRNA (cytosine1402-N4)-methyltransferase
MVPDHVSVLHDEAIMALAIKANGYYVDATYGRGGHSASILGRLGSEGRLLAIDCDADAIAHAQALARNDDRFCIVHRNYSELVSALHEVKAPDQVDGVLFDLGVSSPQLDVSERGFSFDRDGPLDMRMDQSRGQPVSAWLAQVSQQELAEVFRSYGEERYANRIATRVVEVASQRPITTTAELAELIKKAHPRWERHKHPATRCFQALRIYINRELDNLKLALQACVDVLRPGGRLVVISFHSLEDRIVKQFVRGAEKKAHLPRGLPVMETPARPPFKAVGKAIRPGPREIDANPRARSSIMRIAERVAA